MRIRVDRLAWVHQIPRITYDNGDQADYLDVTFRCTWLEGEPYPADGEMTEVGWRRLDDLGDVSEEQRTRIAVALAEGDARFEGGA